MLNVKTLVKKRWLMAGLMLLCVIAYGFMMINSALGIDDPRFDMYLRGGLRIASERWTSVLVNIFTGVYDYRPVVHELLGCLGLAVAGFFMCAMFMTASHGKMKPMSCFVYIATLITFPLLFELFAYKLECISIGAMFALSACVLLIWKYSGWKLLPKYLFSGVLCILMFGFLESFVCILLCFLFELEAVAFYYSDMDKKTMVKLFWQSVLTCFLLLVASYIAYRLISLAIRSAFHYSYVPSSRTVTWNLSDLGGCLKNLIMTVGLSYCLAGMYYLPIGEYVICALLCGVGCLCQIKKRPAVALSLLACLASTLLLSLLMGTAAPYRTALVLAPFAALFVMLAVQACCGLKRAWLRRTLVMLCCILPLVQAINFNNWAYVDYLRYQDDASIIHDIGYDLSHACSDKPVVFSGAPTPSMRVVKEIYVSRDSIGGRVLTALEDRIGQKIGAVQSLTYQFDGYVYCYQQSIESVLDWAVGSGDIYQVFMMEGWDLHADGAAKYTEDAARLIASDPDGRFASVSATHYRIYETDDFIAVQFK